MNMIFKMMSEFMETRNLLQCRSHHQKMIEKYRGLRAIVTKIKAKTPKIEYQSFFQENIEKIEALYQEYKIKGLIRSQKIPNRSL